MAAVLQSGVEPAAGQGPPRARQSPFALLVLALGLVLAGLALAYGPTAALQTTVNGLVAGGYLGLGAIGLTLVLGVLKLVNFAHGDLLVAGAYFTIFFTGSACRCRRRCSAPWSRRRSSPW